MILFQEDPQCSVASVSQLSHQPVPPLGDELPNSETVFQTQRTASNILACVFVITKCKI